MAIFCDAVSCLIVTVLSFPERVDAWDLYSCAFLKNKVRDKINGVDDNRTYDSDAFNGVVQEGQDCFEKLKEVLPASFFFF